MYKAKGSSTQLSSMGSLSILKMKENVGLKTPTTLFMPPLWNKANSHCVRELVAATAAAAYIGGCSGFGMNCCGCLLQSFIGTVPTILSVHTGGL